MDRKGIPFALMLIFAMLSAGSGILTQVTSQGYVTVTTQVTTTGLTSYPVATEYVATTQISQVYGPNRFTINGTTVRFEDFQNICWNWGVVFNGTQGERFHIQWTSQPAASLDFYVVTSSIPRSYNCGTGTMASAENLRALFSYSAVNGSVDWVAPSARKYFGLLVNDNPNSVSGTLSIEASTITPVASISYSTVKTTYLLGTQQIVTSAGPSGSGSLGPTGIMIAVGAIALLGSIAIVARRKKVHKVTFQDKDRAIAETRLAQTGYKLDGQPPPTSSSVSVLTPKQEAHHEPVSWKSVNQPTQIHELPTAERRVSSAVVQPSTEITVESSRPPRASKVATGYSEFDDLLHGGIPEGYSVLMISPPYDEKDLLLRKMIGASLSSNLQVFYVSSDLGRTQDLIGRFKADFDAFCPDAHRISSSADTLHDIPGIGNLSEFNILLNKGLSERMKEGKPKLLVMDLASDVLVRYRGATTRKWLADFIGKRRAQNFTTVCTLNPAIASKEESSRIIDLFDGIIEINEKEERGRARRFLTVKKMYGQEYSESELQLNRTKLF